MIKRLFAYLLPLWMVAGVFAFTCLVSGVDLTIQNDNGCVKVGTANNTLHCAMFQWNTTLDTNDWHDYHGYIAAPGETPCPQLSFTVTADNNRVFWRLRECAFP